MADDSKSSLKKCELCIICMKKESDYNPLIKCCHCSFIKRHPGCAENEIGRENNVCNFCDTMIQYQCQFYKKSILFKKFLWMKSSRGIIFHPCVLMLATIPFISITAYISYLFVCHTISDINYGQTERIPSFFSYFILYVGISTFFRFIIAINISIPTFVLLRKMHKQMCICKRIAPYSIKNVRIYDMDTDIFVPRVYHHSGVGLKARIKSLFCLRSYHEYAIMKMAERDVETSNRGRTFIREEEPIPMNWLSNNSCELSSSSTSMPKLTSPCSSTSRQDGIELARNANISVISIVKGGIASSTPLSTKHSKTVRFDLSAIEEESFPVMALDVSKLSEDHHTPPSTPSNSDNFTTVPPRPFHSPQPETAPADDVYVV